MQRDSFHNTVRSLDDMSDAQIAALTFPKGGLRIETPLVLTERYMGGTKLPPGPPNGLERQQDGSYSLTRVAIVRVQPDEYRLMAEAMVKKANLQSVVVGAVCGLVVAAAAFAALMNWQKNVNSLGQAAPAPCLVSNITATAVACRVGEQTMQVELGKYFPDGRYLLHAVDPAQLGFTATRMTDRQTVVFQADRKITTPPSGAITK